MFVKLNGRKSLFWGLLWQGWREKWNRSMVRPFLKESLVLSVYVKQERDLRLTSIGLLVSVAAQHVRHWRDHYVGLMA